MLIYYVGAGCRERASVVDLHANVVLESIAFHIDSSTILVWNIDLLNGIPDINGISTEVSHIRNEYIASEYDVGCLPVLPVGRVY